MTTDKREIDDKFLFDLKQGILKDVAAFIKSNAQEYILCFRNNYINVYYRGHSIYKIEKNSGVNKYTISFNFNHARYTKDWKEKLKQLEKLSFVLKEYKSKSRVKDRILKTKLSDTSTLNFDIANKIVRGLIDDFFDDYKRIDYFSEENGLTQSTKSKRKLLEKMRQQQIYIENQNTDDGFCFYDMEFTQSRDTDKDEHSGKFDMLAIEFANGKPQYLVFIELKSTKSACKGKSGLAKHNEDFDRYINNSIYVNMRKEEAKKNFNAFIYLGLITSEILNDIASLPVKKLFIFTDEAIRYASGLSNICETKILTDDFIVSH